MYFRGKHIILKCQENLTCLESKVQPLTRHTVDSRFEHVLQLWKRGGGNPPPSSDTLAPGACELSNQTTCIPMENKQQCCVLQEKSVKRQIYTRNDESLPPHSAILITVDGQAEIHHISTINSVNVRINDNNPLYEGEELLIGEGVYSVSSELNVLACNHSNRIRTIPKGTLLGYSTQINPMGYVTEASLNELDSTGDPPEQRDYSLCLLYTSPSPRDSSPSRMPSSA